MCSILDGVVLSVSTFPLPCRLLGKSLEPQSDEERKEEKRGFDNNGFNQFRSDRISLDREIPDTRDPR